MCRKHCLRSTENPYETVVSHGIEEFENSSGFQKKPNWVSEQAMPVKSGYLKFSARLFFLHHL